MKSCHVSSYAIQHLWHVPVHDFNHWKHIFRFHSDTLKTWKNRGNYIIFRHFICPQF